jgi:hypothetical protein
MQTNPSPEQIGYIVGVLIGIAISIGIFIFAIIAIVKAFTKKTTGWIIAGSIGGVLVLFLMASFAVGFIRGFTGALHKSEASQNDSADLSLADSQTIQGRNILYSIKIPSDWTVQRQKKDFDILANHKTTFIGVIAEEADMGSSENISDLAHKHLENVAENIQWSEPTPVVVDGRNWLRFSVTCRVQKIPFFYQYYVYSGTEGTFQIIMWTFQNLADKNTAQMDAVAQSFTFPKKL